ncbi:MAG: hypothetical protein IPK39_14770 [Sulfuritalea sp.]|nr:hypothetical protein [Sulfuritalea sp.]
MPPTVPDRPALRLNVGLTAGRGTANGTLIMGAGTAITTAAANIGMGGTTEGGATGTLESAVAA